MDAPYAKLEAVAPGVARVLAHNPSAFTYFGTQTYLLGERELAVIDPGPDLPEHVDALVAAIGDRPLSAILVTHTHRDHSPAARALAAATGAPVIGCAPLMMEGTGLEAGFDPHRELRAFERLLGSAGVPEAIGEGGVVVRIVGVARRGPFQHGHGPVLLAGLGEGLGQLVRDGREIGRHGDGRPQRLDAILGAIHRRVDAREVAPELRDQREPLRSILRDGAGLLEPLHQTQLLESVNAAHLRGNS